jgi:uncharacterized protein YdhG (YjbR/CyaY superfamily)
MKGVAMNKGKSVPRTVDEYINACPERVRPKLQELRSIIKRIVPDAEERISYRMPAYFLNGVLVYFGAHTNHIGFYPTASGIAGFKKDFLKYKYSKGAVQFPTDQPLPARLIRRIVEFRVEENQKAKKGKY